MNKKSAFYKYAKLYSYLIKQADYTPLPNSGVLGLRDSMQQQFPQFPDDAMFKGTQKDVFNAAYNRYRQDIRSSFDVASQYNNARANGAAWAADLRNINNANRVRAMFMPTYSPQVQPIVQQLPIYSYSYLGPNSNYDPVSNRMNAGSIAMATPHELEHLIDVTRSRPSINTTGYRKIVEANNLNSLTANISTPEEFVAKVQGSAPARARVRMEQIANTVPQMRLRRMWGPNLTPNQQAILGLMDENSRLSMSSYNAYLPGTPITADNVNQMIEKGNQLAKRSDEFMRKVNRELRLAHVTPRLQDARPVNVDEFGNRFTIADNIRSNVNRLVANRQISPEQAQQIIDAQLRELATRKSIARKNRKLIRANKTVLSNPNTLLDGRINMVTTPPTQARATMSPTFATNASKIVRSAIKAFK